MVKISVSTDWEKIRKTVAEYATVFPLSGVRLSAFDYLVATHGQECSHKSFMVLIDDDPVCCVLSVSDGRTLSFFGQPVRVEFAQMTHLAPSDSLTVLKNMADQIRSDVEVVQEAFIEVPFAEETTNPLIELLAPKAISHTTFIEAWADLSLGAPHLTKGIRKSHRQSIEKARTTLGEPTTHCGDMPGTIFEAFKRLHIQVAGRQTRSDASWEEMRGAVTREDASLTVVNLDGEILGGTFCWISTSSASYGTGAYDRTKFSSIPVSHLPLFSAMAHAQQIGKKVFILGEAYAPAGSQKEKNIAQFKRGFSAERRFFHRLVLAE